MIALFPSGPDLREAFTPSESAKPVLQDRAIEIAPDAADKAERLAKIGGWDSAERWLEAIIDENWDEHTGNVRRVLASSSK